MDPQIHGALVGGALAGVLGGLTVAGGVILDLRFRAKYEGQQRLRDAVIQLNDELQRATAGLDSGGVPGDLVQRGQSLMRQIGVVLRHAPHGGKSRQAVHDAAVDLMSMWTGLLIRLESGKPIDVADQLVLGMPILRMNEALYGAFEATDVKVPSLKRAATYAREGLSAPELPDLRKGDPSTPA